MWTLVIGATGFVGRSLTKLLREHGHVVAGLARSDESAAKLEEAGLGVVRGDVLKPETYLDALMDFDAIVFMPRIELHAEYEVVTAILDRLAGTGKQFLFTSGTGVLVEPSNGEWREESLSEDDPFNRSTRAGERVETEDLVRAAADRGVRAMVIRPPLIWGYGHQRALAAVHASAESGAVCYLGSGLNVMSSIHVDDLAEIFRLAIEKGVPGALYHAVSGEHCWRAIAAEVARLRGLPVRSVDLEEARERFGFIIAEIVFAMTSRTRCPRTRKELGWTPHPDRLDIYGELAHPTFMANAGTQGSDLDKYFIKQPA